MILIIISVLISIAVALWIGCINNKDIDGIVNNNNNNNQEAMWFMIFSCFINVCMVFLVKYWERKGFKWYNIAVITQSSACFYYIFLWLIYSAVSAVWINNSKFKTQLLSIFPSKSNKNFKKIWCQIIINGIVYGFQLQAKYIALLYCTGGDASVLYVGCVSVVSIIAGKFFFVDKINKFVIIALLLALVGLVLIIQPSLLFKNNLNSSTVSYIGVIFTVVASFFNVGNKMFIKYSGYLGNSKNKNDKSGTKIDWYCLSMMTTIIAFIVYMIEYSIFIIYCNYSTISSYNKNELFKNDWNYVLYQTVLSDSGTHSNEYDITLSLTLYVSGLLPVSCQLFKVIAFRMGQFSHISLIANIKSVFAYLIDAWLFNTVESILSYVGSATLLCSVLLVTSTQIKSKIQDQDSKFDYQIIPHLPNIDNSTDKEKEQEKEKDKEENRFQLV